MIKPKKGDLLELRVDSLAYGGKGVSTYDGIIIFTEKTIPGQLIKAEIIKDKKTFLEGRSIETIEKSIHEIEPKCSHFQACGGCKIQHLEYSEQLNQKQKQILEVFKHLGKINLNFNNPIESSPLKYQYRNKMEFSFSNQRWIEEDGGGNKPLNFALGLHPQKKYDKVVDIDQCEIQSKEGNTILNIVKSFCKQNNLEPYNIKKHKGFMRQLVIKHASYSNQIMINIVTTYNQPKLLFPLVNALLNEVKIIKTIVNTINNRKADISYSDNQNVLYGENIIKEKLNEYKFEISANSFFQTNSMQALTMYNYIEKESKLSGKEVVYDFYCGIGTISIFLAKNAKKIYGFEIVESAIKDAKKNATLNNINNVDFYCGDLTKKFNDNQKFHIEKTVDILIADPPRSGIHKKTIKKIIGISPKKIIYVSCNPSTQVRDVKEFLLQGYYISNAQAFDMFPHTHHIENIITMEKNDK